MYSHLKNDSEVGLIVEYVLFLGMYYFRVCLIFEGMLYLPTTSKFGRCLIFGSRRITGKTRYYQPNDTTTRRNANTKSPLRSPTD